MRVSIVKAAYIFLSTIIMYSAPANTSIRPLTGNTQQSPLYCPVLVSSSDEQVQHCRYYLDYSCELTTQEITAFCKGSKHMAGREAIQ